MSIDDYFKKKGTTSNTGTTPKTSGGSIDNYFKKMDYERTEQATQPVAVSATTTSPAKTGTDLIQTNNNFNVTPGENNITLTQKEEGNNSFLSKILKLGGNVLKTTNPLLGIATKKALDINTSFQQDTQGMSQKEKGEYIKNATTDFAKASYLGVSQGYVTSVQGINEANKFFYDKTGLSKIANYDQDYEKIKKQGEDDQEALQWYLKDLVGEEDVERLWTQMGSGVGQGVFQLGTATINPYVGIAAISGMSVQSGKEAADKAYSTILEQGGTEKEAKKIANINGIATGVLNMLDVIIPAKAGSMLKGGIKRLFQQEVKKDIEKAGLASLKFLPTISRLGKDILIESGTEGLQEGGSALVAKLTYDETRQPLKEALLAALISVPTSILFGSASEAGVRIGRNKLKTDIKEKIIETGVDNENAKIIADIIVDNVVIAGEDAYGDIKQEQKQQTDQFEQAISSALTELPLDPEQQQEFDSTKEFLKQEDKEDEALFKKKEDTGSDLTVEAKKYKSAEEFVKAQKDKFIEEQGFEPSDKALADWFEAKQVQPYLGIGGQNPEFFAGKPSLSELPKNEISKYLEFTKDGKAIYYRGIPKDVKTRGIRYGDFISPNKSKASFYGNVERYELDPKYVKQLGDLEAVYLNEADKLKIPKVTKLSQLTDIWNKAQEEDKPAFKEDKKLVTVHNISIEKYNKSKELGGFANPSVAIIDPNKSDFTKYGEISLIADKDLIDPASTKKSKTYGADVYSPRFPSVINTVENIKSFREVSELYNLESLSIDDFFFSSKRNTSVLEAFLKEQNIDIPNNISELDYYDKRDLLVSKINESKLDDELSEFVNRLANELGIIEKLYAGYTNAGYKKLVEITAENASKLMNKDQDRGGEGFMYGLPNIRALLAPQFKTLNQIKKNQDKIVSSEEFGLLKDSYNSIFMEIMDELIEYDKTEAKNDYGIYGATATRLTEYLLEGKTAIDRYYENVPDALIEKIDLFGDSLKEMPTEYFETKFRRVVQPNEFKYAVIPNTTNKKTRESLKNDNLEIIEYNPQIEGDRMRAINELDEVKFKEKEDNKYVSYKLGLETIKKLQAQHGVQFPVQVYRTIYTGEVDNGNRVEASGMYIDNTISFAEKVERYTAQHEFGHFLFRHINDLPQLKGLDKNKIYEELRIELKDKYGKYSLIELEEYLMSLVEKRAKDIENGTYKEPKQKSLLDKVIDAVINLFKDIFGLSKNERRSIDVFLDQMYFGKNDKGIITFQNTGKTSDFMEARFREFGEDVEPVFKEKDLSNEDLLNQLESYLYDLEEQLAGHPGSKFKKFIGREGQVEETNLIPRYTGSSITAKHNLRMRAESRESKLLAASRSIEEEHSFLGDRDGYNEGNVTMMNDVIEKYYLLKENVAGIKAQIKVVKENIKDEAKAIKQEEKDIAKSYRKTLDLLKMENTYNDFIEEMYDASNTEEDITLAEEIRKTVPQEVQDSIIKGIATQRTTKGRKTAQQIRNELFPGKDKLTITEQNQIKTRLKEQEKGYRKGFTSGKDLGTSVEREKQTQVIKRMTRDQELKKLKENIIWRSHKKTILTALKDNIPRKEWSSYMVKLSEVGTSETKFVNLLDKVLKRGAEIRIEEGERMDLSRMRSNIGYLKHIYDIEPSLILSIKKDLNIRDTYKRGELAGELKDELKSIKDYTMEELIFFKDELNKRIQFRKDNPKTFFDKVTVQKDKTYIESLLNGLSNIDKVIIAPRERVLQKISNPLYESFMSVFAQEEKDQKEGMRALNPIFDVFVKMSKDDQELFKMATQSGDETRTRSILEMYKNTKEEIDTMLNQARDTFNKIHKDFNEVGVDVPYLKFFFPRMLKPMDVDNIKLMIETYQYKEGKKLTEEEKQEIFDKFSRAFTGQLPFITLSGKKFEAHRLIETMTNDVSDFYEDFATATINYIHSSATVINQRRFFGKSQVENIDYETSVKESIGKKVMDLYDQGLINNENISDVQDVLMDIFHHRQGKITSAVQRVISNYIYPLALNQIASTLRQFKDTSMQFIINDFFEFRFNTIRALMYGNITLEQVNQDNTMRELETDVHNNKKNWLTRMLGKTLFTFELIDSTLLQLNIRSAYQRSIHNAKTNNKEFVQGVYDIFGKVEGDKFIDELKTMKGDEKIPPEQFARWVFSETARTRPITKLQKTKGAIHLPFAYVLKNFAVKQLQFVRKEAIDHIVEGIKTGDKDKVLRGIYRTIIATIVIFLINAGVDEIVDMLLNRKDQNTYWEAGIENLMQIIFMNRYTLDKMKQGTPVRTFLDSLLPAPISISSKIGDDAIKDFNSFNEGDFSPNTKKSTRLFPFVGSVYSNWFGTSSEWNEKTSTTQKKDSAVEEYVTNGKTAKFTELTKDLTKDEKEALETKGNKQKKFDEVFTDKKDLRYAEDLSTGTNAEKVKLMEKMIKKEGTAYVQSFITKGRSTYKSATSGNQLRVLISDSVLDETKKMLK